MENPGFGAPGAAERSGCQYLQSVGAGYACSFGHLSREVGLPFAMDVCSAPEPVRACPLRTVKPWQLDAATAATSARI